MQNNSAAVNLYRRLGFQEVDQGIVFRKETPVEPSTT
jgi:ribosomal protein S18 acetylase RimI-like enzyme